MRSRSYNLVLSTLGMTIICSFASTLNKAIAASDGEKIFSANCASCHVAGGNIVDPSKPLKGSKKLASKESLKSLLMNPVGAMPSFPKIAGNDADLTALQAYCKSLK